MNSLFLSLRKSTKYLSYPFIFSAVFLILGGILCCTPLYEVQGIRLLWSEYSPLLYNTAAVGFIVYFEAKGSKKALGAMLSYLCCDMAYFCFSGYHFGFLISVLLGFVISKLLGRMNIIYGYVITLLSGLIIGICLGAIYPLISDIIMMVAAFFKGKGAVFGAVDNLLVIMLGNNLSDIFYNSDYTGAMLIDDNVTAGIKNIFSAVKDNPNGLVSKYLTGKYIANIFIPTGAYIMLYGKLEKEELNALTLLLIPSVLFGESTLFYAFVFLFNPMVYFGNAFCIFMGYLICELIDIRIGYVQSGSLIELISYGQKWIYFLLCGLLLTALSYFSSRLLNEKFDIRGSRILPREVRSIVNALGGEENLERISGNKLYVKNPNLINILKIDCDIHENEVSMIYDELDILKDYF